MARDAVVALERLKVQLGVQEAALSATKTEIEERENAIGVKDREIENQEVDVTRAAAK